MPLSTVIADIDGLRAQYASAARDLSLSRKSRDHFSDIAAECARAVDALRAAKGMLDRGPQ